MTSNRESIIGLRRYLPLCTFSILFLPIVGSLAIIYLYVGGKALSAPGPNTVGEAGKVYFAQRCCSADGLFAAGDMAPFYPSFHGVILHASVGIIGKVTGASTTDLYYIGRSISVICTILALVLCGLLLRRWGIDWWWMIPLLMVFLAAYRVTQHAYSYRPDHWLLLLSVLSCYLLITRVAGRWELVILTIIPVLAFFIKATGAVLLPIVLVVLLLQRRRCDATIFALTSPLLNILCVEAINAISGGTFLAAMRNAAGAGYSISLMFDCLKAQLMWVPLLVPLFMLHRVSWTKSDPVDERAIVMIFWAITLVWACLTSVRIGANSYYFLEPFTFGLILTVDMLAQMLKTEPSDVPSKSLPLLVMLAISLQAFPLLYSELEYIKLWGRPRYDISLVETLKFNGDRQYIVKEIRRYATKNNGYDWMCLSDDPGLNVLLDRPVMVQPLLTSMMIKNGSVDTNKLLAPIKQRRIAMIVLTGHNWSYAGIKRLPDAVTEAIRQNYHRVNNGTQYTVFAPNNDWVRNESPAASWSAGPKVPHGP